MHAGLVSKHKRKGGMYFIHGVCRTGIRLAASPARVRIRRSHTVTVQAGPPSARCRAISIAGRSCRSCRKRPGSKSNPSSALYPFKSRHPGRKPSLMTQRAVIAYPGFNCAAILIVPSALVLPCHLERCTQALLDTIKVSLQKVIPCMAGGVLSITRDFIT